MLDDFPVVTDEVRSIGAIRVVEEVHGLDRPAVDEKPDRCITSTNSVGQTQGPQEVANIDHIKRLRDRKLAPLAFLIEPSEKRQPGKPLNFLSPELLAEFDVPELPPVSAHAYPDSIVTMIQNNPDKLFLDVGAGLRPTYYANVVNTEIYPSISTDVLCVGEAMPFANEQFDYVFCFATLEHTRRPWDVATEICRVLKPGGTLMIDYPFMQPVHGYPHHYFNATPMGNRSLFEPECDIQSVEIGWHHHPMIGLQWILTVFRNGLEPDDAAAFGNLRVKDLVDQPLEALLKASYAVNLHHEAQRVIASGSMLTAIKKTTPIRPLRNAVFSQKPAAPHGSSAGGTRPRTATDDAMLADLKHQNALLRTQQAALLQSTSWRLTLPLRSCARFLFHRAG